MILRLLLKRFRREQFFGKAYGGGSLQPQQFTLKNSQLSIKFQVPGIDHQNFSSSRLNHLQKPFNSIDW